MARGFVNDDGTLRSWPEIEQDERFGRLSESDQQKTRKNYLPLAQQDERYKRLDPETQLRVDQRILGVSSTDPSIRARLEASSKQAIGKAKSLFRSGQRQVVRISEGIRKTEIPGAARANIALEAGPGFAGEVAQFAAERGLPAPTALGALAGAPTTAAASLVRVPETIGEATILPVLLAGGGLIGALRRLRGVPMARTAQEAIRRGRGALQRRQARLGRQPGAIPGASTIPTTPEEAALRLEGIAARRADLPQPAIEIPSLARPRPSRGIAFTNQAEFLKSAREFSKSPTPEKATKLLTLAEQTGNPSASLAELEKRLGGAIEGGIDPGGRLGRIKARIQSRIAALPTLAQAEVAVPTPRKGLPETLQRARGVPATRTTDEATLRLERAVSKAPKKPLLLQPETPETLPKTVLGANLSRLNTSDDAKRLIMDVARTEASTIQIARRGKISQSEMIRLADAQGMSVKELISRNRGQAFNAEQALASRRLLVQSAENLVNKAQSVAAGTGSLSDFGTTMSQHILIQAEAAGVRAEAGRTLFSFRIKRGAGTEKAIQEFLKQIEGQQITEAMAQRLAKLDPRDPASVNRFIRGAIEASASEKLLEAWINALLSGPQTQIVNTASNSLTAMTRPAERIVTASMDLLRSPFRGGKREVFFGEAAADVYGMAEGVPDGFRNAIRTFADEIGDLMLQAESSLPPLTAPLLRRLGPARKGLERIAAQARPVSGLGKIELPKRRAIRGLTGAIVRVPGNLLFAADDFFKTVNRAGEVRALAYRDAIKKGLTGQRRVDHIASIITGRNPESKKFFMSGEKEAVYRTFTQELGPIGRDIQSLRNKIPLARVVIPFLRTPINIAKFGIERTPLGFIQAVSRARARGPGKIKSLNDVSQVVKQIFNTREGLEDLAKPVFGTIMGAATAHWVAQGKITGGGPIDPTRRRVLRAAGWQPYSVRIGNRFFSYSRLEPLGITVGLAADYVELQDIIDTEEAVSKIAFAFSQNLSSKTFLRSISDLINAVADPERHGARWIQRLATSIVPTVVRGIARAQEVPLGELLPEIEGFSFPVSGLPERAPVLRRPSSVKEAILAGIPGAAGDVPVLRDIWGRPVVIGEGITNTTAERIFSPIYVRTITEDKATRELVRLGIKVGSPRRQILRIELTPEQFDRYVALSGMLAKRRVDQMVNSAKWGRTSRLDKEDAINDAFRSARRNARNVLFPDLRRQFQEQEKIKAGKESTTEIEWLKALRGL